MSVRISEIFSAGRKIGIAVAISLQYWHVTSENFDGLPSTLQWDQSRLPSQAPIPATVHRYQVDPRYQSTHRQFEHQRLSQNSEYVRRCSNPRSEAADFFAFALLRRAAAPRPFVVAQFPPKLVFELLPSSLQFHAPVPLHGNARPCGRRIQKHGEVHLPMVNFRSQRFDGSDRKVQCLISASR